MSKEPKEVPPAPPAPPAPPPPAPPAPAPAPTVELSAVMERIQLVEQKLLDLEELRTEEANPDKHEALVEQITEIKTRLMETRDSLARALAGNRKEGRPAPVAIEQNKLPWWDYLGLFN